MKDTLLKYFQKKSLYSPEDCTEVRNQLNARLQILFGVCSAPQVAVVIPVKNEYPGIKDTLASLSASAGSLYRAADSLAHDTNSRATLHVVCVVNSRENDDGDVKQNNVQMLSSLSACSYENLFVSVIDKTSPGNELSEKEGVGLARKIGMDYALACGAEVIACMDADTLVAENYAEELFRFAQNHGKRSFALVPFRHQKASTEKLQQAIDTYENYMMLHSKKLRETGTPYWAPILGPSLVCTAEGYVSCGGMNKRVSGEDFYFLQSLVKIEISSGCAQSCTASNRTIDYSPLFLNTEVYPSARISDRVLFGTGPKLRELTETISEKSKIECPIYPDRCYEAIKEFIEKKESCQNELAGFMNKENFLSVWNKICANNPSNPESREIAFHIWFDGLKIIRAIHAVQAVL
ncbi:MAG: glycosyltransferase [Spirochaetaceae bacterium]|nr:glycosyltransferase [Spirochaetaceae bacterium]